MAAISPHWKTAPSVDPGNRVAHFVECDRCGYRNDDISRQGRKCQRLANPESLSVHAEWRRCDGTLRGRRTAGW